MKIKIGKLYENFRPMYNRHLDMIQDSFPLEFSKKILKLQLYNVIIWCS